MRTHDTNNTNSYPLVSFVLIRILVSC